MPLSGLPRTRRKYAFSAKWYVGKIDFENVSIASVLQAFVTGGGTPQLIPIGAIESFSEDERRDARAQYELDAEKPGLIVEQIPQLLTRTLTIDRAVLYKLPGKVGGDFLEATGLSDVSNLVGHKEPFVIIKIDYRPTESGEKKVESVTAYCGCWVTANPKRYEVRGELKIVQSIPVSYSRKFIYDVDKGQVYSD